MKIVVAIVRNCGQLINCQDLDYDNISADLRKGEDIKERFQRLTQVDLTTI